MNILYENADLVAIEKPAGTVVNDADTAQGETIQSWWSSQLPRTVHGEYKFPVGWEQLIPQDWTSEFGTAEEIFTERGGVVHRLDKETSGVLLLAKHPGSLIHLLMQFRHRQTKKRYLCLVHGKFKIEEDTVSFPIARSSIDRMKFQVVPDGRVSETKYRVLNFYTQFNVKIFIEKNKNALEKQKHLRQKLAKSYQGFSLVECWPKTGRTHQIRVHMTHLRHPIVADPLYVGTKRHNLDQLWCPRLFLHAAQLEWTDPRSAEVCCVDSPLTPELSRALEYLIP